MTFRIFLSFSVYSSVYLRISQARLYRDMTNIAYRNISRQPCSVMFTRSYSRVLSCSLASCSRVLFCLFASYSRVLSCSLASYSRVQLLRSRVACARTQLVCTSTQRASFFNLLVGGTVHVPVPHASMTRIVFCCLKYRTINPVRVHVVHVSLYLIVIRTLRSTTGSSY